MQHDWFQHPKFRPLVTCRACGIVQNDKNRDKPCKGKVRVVLRENRVKDTPHD